MKHTLATLLWLSCCLGLAAQDSVPPANSDQTVVLSPFDVQSSQDHGYASTNAVSGTRFSVPVSDIPQSIVVINQDFLRDVGATSVLDAAEYVSGVTSTAGGERDQFLVRGYAVSVTIDGMPDGSPEGQGLTTPTEVTDRVEIIKGPSAVLYGSTSPGGNVNRVEKKPLYNSAEMFEAAAGGEGYNHDWFDVNYAAKAPLGEVGLRVIGSYAHYDEYVNFRDANRYVFAPEAGWRLSPKTVLTVIPYYIYDNHHKTFGNLFQYPPYGMNAPISFNLPRDVDWSTAYERESMLVHRIFATLEQQINEHWSMRFLGIVKSEDDIDGDLIPLDLLPYQGGYLMPRTWRWTYASGTYHDWAYDNLFNFDLGPVKNKALFLLQFDSSAINSTVDTGRKLSGQDTAIGENASNTVSNMPLINILTYVPDMTEPDQKYVSASSYAYSQDFAWSAQDEAEMFNRHVFVNAGVRYDHSEQWGLNLLTHAFTVATTNPDGVGLSEHYTKRAGIVYQPTAGLSLFFNYSETFAPTFHINPDGTALTAPTIGSTYEIGPKFDLLDGRISGTLAAFQIKDFNVLATSTNPVLASAGYDTQSGYNMYKGVETDLYFNMVKNLQLIGSASFLSPTTFNGATSTVTRVRNVSDTTVALFASYKFGGDLRWTGGVGGHYKSKQPGDTGNTFYLPSATVFDAFLKYEYTKAVTFQLNVGNVFNRYYADSSVSRDIIYAGPERRLTLAVTYRR